MIRISSTPSADVERLKETTFENENLLEKDLRNLISENATALLPEIGEPNLLLLPPEFYPQEGARERIDLLGIDVDGTSVVIELKRGRDKGHMLQALSYAAMLASREASDFEKHLRPEQLSDLKLASDLPINHSQRIVLIAEGFTKNVAIACQWLGRFKIEMRCIEFRADRAADGALYLSFNRVYPPPYSILAPGVALPPELETLAAEINQFAKVRLAEAKKAEARAPSSPLAAPTPETRADAAQTWEEFLAAVENQDLARFLKRWEDAGEPILPNSGHRLIYPRHPERWRIEARPKKNRAWVMQSGRFNIGQETDEQFWKSLLDDTANVRVLRNGTRLHFDLQSRRDFDAFWDAIHDTLRNVSFHIT